MRTKVFVGFLAILALLGVVSVTFADGNVSGAGGGKLLPRVGTPQSAVIVLKTSEPISVSIAETNGSVQLGDNSWHLFPGELQLSKYYVSNASTASYVVELAPFFSGMRSLLPEWQLRYTTASPEFLAIEDGKKAYLLMRGRSDAADVMTSVWMKVWWPKDADVSALPTATVGLRAFRTDCVRVQTCVQEIALASQIRQIKEIPSISDSEEEMALLQLLEKQLRGLQESQQ